MKFDFRQKTLQIGVGELLDFARSAHRDFSNDAWWIRLGLGTEIHSRIVEERRARLPDFQAEIPVDWTFEIEGWQITLQGRADGLFVEGDTTIVEEYKTSQLLPERAVALHVKQLQSYVLMLEKAGRSQLVPRLVYYSLVHQQFCSFNIDCDSAATEKWISEAVNKVLKACREKESRRQEKSWAAMSLPFPHKTLRTGQELLSKKIEETLQFGGALLAQAPTGIGKTAGSLFSGLKVSLQKDRRLLFLTSKTLQQNVVVKTLNLLNSSGAFRSIQLAAKEKMCANDRVLCHEDACPYAKDYGRKLEETKLIPRLVSSKSHFSPEETFQAAKTHKVCPFEVQLELAREADVIVADYNYLFEPAAFLSFLTEDGEAPLLILDEAHNLADRVREIYSPVLSNLLLHPALDFLAPHSATHERVVACIGELNQILQTTCVEKLKEIEPPEEISRLWEKWEPALIYYFNWKSETDLLVENDPVMELHFVLSRWRLVTRNYGDGFSCVSEKFPNENRISIRCIDPSEVIAGTMKKVGGAVLLSATLQPFTATARTLGLKEADKLDIPSPFPAENRLLMIYPQISTTFQSRPRCYGECADLIQKVAATKCGRTLVLFPSYEFLKQTQSLCGELLATGRLLTQLPNAGPREQQELFSRLEGIKDGILFAVLGGMYAEGLDYPNNLLRGVVVISPGLPQISWQRELLRRHYEEETRDGFLYAYVQPGMTKVIQAAGRLIRSERDRGFVLLVCNRFLQQPYSALIPPSWLDSQPITSSISTDPAGDISRFFGGL